MSRNKNPKEVVNNTEPVKTDFTTTKPIEDVNYLPLCSDCFYGKQMNASLFYCKEKRGTVRYIKKCDDYIIEKLKK